MHARTFLATAVVLGSVALAPAYQISDLILESWTGSGPHQVVLIVDFWPYNGAEDSFAFGHRFEQAEITGLDLLQALHDAPNGFTCAHASGFVTDIWYDDGHQVHHTGYQWPDSYWSYWVSADFGETWEFAPTGAPGRILGDGETDGWLAKPGNDPDSEPVTPLLLDVPGDMNCDNRFDFDDINPFVLALSDPAGYAQRFTTCNILRGDINEDGKVDFGDINPFIDLIIPGGA